MKKFRFPPKSREKREGWSVSTTLPRRPIASKTNGRERAHLFYQENFKKLEGLLSPSSFRFLEIDREVIEDLPVNCIFDPRHYLK